MPDFRTVELSVYATDVDADLWPVIKGKAPHTQVIVRSTVEGHDKIVKRSSVASMRAREQTTHMIDLSKLM